MRSLPSACVLLAALHSEFSLSMRVRPSSDVFENVSSPNADNVIAQADQATTLALSGLAKNASTASVVVPRHPLDLPHREHHKDPDLRHPFWELQWELVQPWPTFWCSVALFLSGILCSAAGIGGGGIYVVVLMLCGMLTPHDAVPLSKGVVFFGSLSTLGLNLARMFSDTKDKAEKVIDFNAVRIVAPACLGGTFLGVLFNWHSEGVAIVLCLAAILIFMTCMTARTAYQQYQAENAALVGNPPEGAATPGAAPGVTAQLPAAAQKAEAGGRKRADEFTTLDIVLSVGLEVIVILSGALRFHMTSCENELTGKGVPGSCTHPVVELFFGGHLANLIADPFTNSLLKSVTTLVPLTLCLLLMVTFGQGARQEGWKVTDVMSFQLMALCTGCFAGLVGVGGGLVFAPFFLVMGLEPAAAVATSSTCVLFTSSSTTAQYFLSDRIIVAMALIYGLVCTVASYLGTTLVHVLQDTFKGRKSYVTFIVVVAVALSAVLSLIKVHSELTKKSA